MIDLPDKQFDLHSWGTCAAGIAAEIPEFKILGLECTVWSGPWYEGHGGSRAIASFFDISETEAQYIIYPNRYNFLERKRYWNWRSFKFERFISKEICIAHMDQVMQHYPKHKLEPPHFEIAEKMESDTCTLNV